MFHVKHNLSAEQQEKINNYFSLLKEYNETTNIYSKKAYDKLPFHSDDCINIAELCENKAHDIVDLGSGSGLPSIIVAICCPLASVKALESKSRKTAFLNLVKMELKLDNLEVITQNIPEWIHHRQPKAEVVTAKAFAPFKECYDYAAKIAKRNGKLIVPVSYSQYNELKPLPKNTGFVNDSELQTGYLVTIF